MFKKVAAVVIMVVALIAQGVLPAAAQENPQKTDDTLYSFFLPFVGTCEENPCPTPPPTPVPWQVDFRLATVNAESRSANSTCVRPLASQSGATAAQGDICLLPNTYFSIMSDHDQVFPGIPPYVGNPGTTSSPQYHRVSNFLTGGGDNMGTGPITAGDLTVYYLDVAEATDQAVNAASLQIDPHWYMFLLEQYLARLDVLPRLPLPKSMIFHNAKGTLGKSMTSCGLSSQAVSINAYPALLGHSIYPPMIKVLPLSYVDIFGTTHIMPLDVYECMIPYPLVHSPLNFQYIGLDVLRTQVPEYKEIDDHVKELFASQIVYSSPTLQLTGDPIPNSDNADTGFVTILTGTALALGYGLITKGSGSLQLLRIFMIGPGACSELWEGYNLCVVARTNTTH